jgi:uroporphyrinogen-III decarboxylase
MTRKYAIQFDPEAFQTGSGTEFVVATAGLDGDWVCTFLDLPFDRYYTDHAYQVASRERARSVVAEQIGLDLVGERVFDHGVILNASLFGGAVRYPRNAPPVLEPVVSDPSDVARLVKRVDAISDEGLLHEGELHPQYWQAAVYLEETRGIEQKAPASDGTKGIATVCGQLCTVTNFLTWLYTNQAEMAELTALVARTFERYIRASRNKDGVEGKDGLSFASDLSGLMSPETYERFCGSHERALYDRFAPSGKRFYHADSNMRWHVPALIRIGVTDVNIGPMVSVADILRAAPDMIVHGQVPPTQVLWRGTPDLVVDAVRADVNDILKAGACLRQLVVCTAGSVNPGTPLENIRALLWAAMEYGKLDGTVRPELETIPIDFDRTALVDQIS